MLAPDDYLQIPPRPMRPTPITPSAEAFRRTLSQPDYWKGAAAARAELYRRAETGIRPGGDATVANLRGIEVAWRIEGALRSYQALIQIPEYREWLALADRHQRLRATRPAPPRSRSP